MLSGDLSHLPDEVLHGLFCITTNKDDLVDVRSFSDGADDATMDTAPSGWQKGQFVKAAMREIVYLGGSRTATTVSFRS
jgi:hypothetical protein